MSRNVPLIRAASIAPMHRWLIQKGRAPGPFLERAGLGWVPTNDPILPIPLCGAVGLLVEIARAEGPDAPYRIARERGGFEIGFIGAAALRGPTVRAGFRRLSRQMAIHSTHEIFTVQTEGEELCIRDGWTVNLGDAETLHYVQQYVAGLVDMICGAATGTRPNLALVGLAPHPETGVAHLHPWFGDRVIGRADRLLDILVNRNVAEQLMPEHIRSEASAGPGAEVSQLKLGNSLSEDVTTLLISMLPHVKPSVDSVAAIAGMSGRTFRRRLREEGHSFSYILEQTRAAIATGRLQAPNPPPLRDLASDLGYANQETLTRAVRRWRGKTPSEMKGMVKAAR